MTSRRDVTRLTQAQRDIVDMARRELVGFFATWDLSSPRDVRDALLEVVPSLVSEYGDLASTAAAEWYEDVRPEAGFTARTVEPAPAADVVKDVRYHARHLFGENPEDVLEALSGAVQRHIMYSGRETIARNVALDPDNPRFARVPSGAKTCAWCEMLASRGFVYYDERSAGDLGRGVGEDFHDECDCQVVAEWDRDAHHIEGYDPDAMYDRYLAARLELEAERLDATPKAVVRRMRDMDPARYTDGRMVPSIITDSDVGWPSDWIKPVTPGRWRHILKRHAPDTGTADQFPSGTTEYEIAKIVRSVVTRPDYVKSHPDFANVDNYVRTINGRRYVVGVTKGGDGYFRVNTAFPPRKDGGIL